MKHIIIYAAIGMMALTTSCRHNEENDGHEHHDHNHAEGHVHGHEHSTDTEKTDNSFGGEIVLHPEVAERFGVKTDTIRRGGFRRSVSASGIVLNSSSDLATVTAPAAGIVEFPRGTDLGAEVKAGSVIATIDSRSVSGGDAAAAARADYENARREYERISALWADRLVTAAEHAAAEAAYRRAEAAYSRPAASGTAKSPISGIITSLEAMRGQYVEAGEPIATVASSKTLTLRIDLPIRYASDPAAFTDARVKLPYSGRVIDIAEAGGHRVASTGMPAAGNTSAYIPVYFKVVNDGTFTPGLSFSAELLANETGNIISVPLDALSEQQGRMYVYKKIDDECYIKMPVSTGKSDGRRVAINSGVSDGDIIVVAGTPTVRLAESSAAIPEGHSHNH